LVFKNGVSSASKYLVMYARPNKLNFNRLGLSVGKKAGKAVTRNRIKRLLREVMRGLSLSTPLNYDFVIIARKPSMECEIADFIRDIKRHMTKITGINAMSSKGQDTPVAIEKQPPVKSRGLRNFETGNPLIDITLE
jgi:ribonuclease P protein component